MILSCGEAEAHSEDGQRQGEQPCKNKQDGPNGETVRRKKKKEEKKKRDEHDSAFYTSPPLLFLFLNVISLTHNDKDSPHLSVLVAEVDQTGHMEQQLNKVVQHQQDQAQTVQTKVGKKAFLVRDRETPLTFSKKGNIQTKVPQNHKLNLGLFLFFFLSGSSYFRM